MGLLVAVFAAGAVSGWAIQAWADSSASAKRRPRGERAIAYLAGELSLTTAQQDSVRAVFTRYRPAMDSIWAQVHPRFDSVRARVRADVMPHLTAEQQARYRELTARMDERHRAGDSARHRTR
jgi:Spy/CpxP family protein refolding chaperone